MDAPFGIKPRLRHRQTVLLKLGFEYGDFLSRLLQLGFGLLDGRTLLIFARFDLRIV
jgi:hypothetical protein